jgi:glycosyltransferase involved in cell wall biosynthesis
MRSPTRIVMLGTGLATRGGISSVVHVYRNQGLFQRWPVDYVATHCDGSRIAKLFAAVKGLLALLALVMRHSCAVLHVHAASRASFWRKSIFMSVALLARWPIVFHLHGGGFGRFYAEECGPFSRRLIRFFLDRAASIVVVSEQWETWVRGVSRNPRITCIPNPVVLPALANVSREPGLVLFSGRCEVGKGIFDLLDAAGILRAQVPGLRIECAGDGDIGKVERRAAALGLAARVKMRGWLSRCAGDELLSRASVFVLPSYAEGLPMSLLEAMAAGCPVVATPVGGIPDLVIDGVNGLLVPVGDPRALSEALARILHDSELARRLGRAARSTIESRYTAERSVDRLEQVYAELGVRRRSSPVPRPAQRLQESS